jgi:hypothetical protein
MFTQQNPNLWKRQSNVTPRVVCVSNVTNPTFYISVRSSYNLTQTRDTTTSETSNCALIVSKVVMTQRPANREHAKRVCSKRHHTTLHFPKRETASGSNVNNHCESTGTTVLLTTAVIKVRDNSGQLHKARALLDNGSQQNFIREDLCKKLGISLFPHSTKIRGIGSVSNQTTQSAEIRFNSVDNSFTKTIHCLVMSKITSNLPPQTLDLSNIIIPENIKLADPGSPIDLSLGSALFYDLFKDGIKSIELNNNTSLHSICCLRVFCRFRVIFVCCFRKCL